jgi:hypothetical protein
VREDTPARHLEHDAGKWACPSCGHGTFVARYRVADLVPNFVLRIGGPVLGATVWLASGRVDMGVAVALVGTLIWLVLRFTEWGMRRYWGGSGCARCDHFIMYR